jgi:acetyltransferase-like isoleucine patch superfamily enzyme
MLRKLMAVLRCDFDYFVRFRADKIAYLRYLGARIGNNCVILTRVGNFGSEPWLIELGDHVQLFNAVTLITHDGTSRAFRSRFPEMNAAFGNRFGTIRILDNCTIGYGAIILPGVTIGPNSIVGAGSVVTKDVPPDVVAAGNPARRLRSLEEHIARYRAHMLPLTAQDRVTLRRELTTMLWGEER